ncbi:hypothetical protein K439DRAFT_1382718 [Ramaria rubella]|nr:hypothetical protein K439DRAFT_1382718 [Ramaria rubella]
MFYSPVQDLQRPTHPRLRIRDARDAQIVLEGVRSGILQLVERRLNEGERSMFIRSGAVFVWEESDDEYGLKRWTDGRMWTQSRAREPFLFYESLRDSRINIDSPFTESIDTAGSYRFVDSSPQGSSRQAAYSQYPRGGGQPMGLVKQAYSAWITDPRNSRRRKWHITAYFTQADLNGLPTPVEDACLRNVAIPSGIYRSGKARTRDPEPDGHTHHNHGSHNSDSYRYLSASTSSASSCYDGRLPEDQRLIQMLNSQHIR